MQWQKLDIDHPLLVSQGLVGIEECNDYQMLESICNNRIKPAKVERKRVSKLKKKKKVPSTDTQTVNNSLTPSKSGSSWNIDLKGIEEYNIWHNYGLPDPIIKALIELNFQQPTTIQALTLHAAILGSRDIVGAAETGSGKTLAFGLPILSGILNKKRLNKASQKLLYGLILTPTRELAMQVKQHLDAVAKFIDVNIAVIVGGMASVKQERILSKGPEIIVATPGRLWELIQEGNTHLSQIDSVKYLAIDETDRMLEKSHFEELHYILERLNVNKFREERQNFVFSATLSLVHEVPTYLKKRAKMRKMSPEHKLQKIIETLGITNPKIVDITHPTAVPSSLSEFRISCAFDEKDFYIYYFIQKHSGRTLIFCNSIGCVKRLSNLLNILNCTPLPLHASMPQRQRLKNLEKFKANDNSVLIATDVAARGLDIPKVEHVLHYQIPRTSESYIHRSGRTARASQRGLTVIMMEPSEVKRYVNLCRDLNKSEDIPHFDIQEEYLEAVKKRVNLARELDKLELHIRKENSEDGWLQKAAKEMDIIIDDLVRSDHEDKGPKKKLAALKRNMLMSLLAKPIFPVGFSGKYPLLHVTIKDNSLMSERSNIPLYKPRKKYNKKI